MMADAGTYGIALKGKYKGQYTECHARNKDICPYHVKGSHASMAPEEAAERNANINGNGSLGMDVKSFESKMRADNDFGSSQIDMILSGNADIMSAMRPVKPGESDDRELAVAWSYYDPDWEGGSSDADIMADRLRASMNEPIHLNDPDGSIRKELADRIESTSTHGIADIRRLGLKDYASDNVRRHIERMDAMDSMKTLVSSGDLNAMRLKANELDDSNRQVLAKITSLNDEMSFKVMSDASMNPRFKSEVAYSIMRGSNNGYYDYSDDRLKFNEVSNLKSSLIMNSLDWNDYDQMKDLFDGGHELDKMNDVQRNELIAHMISHDYNPREMDAVQEGVAVMAADERLTRSQADALARHYHAPDKPWYSDTTACLAGKVSDDILHERVMKDQNPEWRRMAYNCGRVTDDMSMTILHYKDSTPEDRVQALYSLGRHGKLTTDDYVNAINEMPTNYEIDKSGLRVYDGTGHTDSKGFATVVPLDASARIAASDSKYALDFAKQHAGSYDRKTLHDVFSNAKNWKVQNELVKSGGFTESDLRRIADNASMKSVRNTAARRLAKHDYQIVVGNAPAF